MNAPADRARLLRREELISRLRAALAADPPACGDQVILFGSFARGDFDGLSDVDVIVVGGDPDRLPPIWRWTGRRDADVLTATPDAWAAGVGMLAQAKRDGVVLWQRATGPDSCAET